MGAHEALGLVECLADRGVRRTLVVCLALQLLQQLSGINAVINFAPAILREAAVAPLFQRFARGRSPYSDTAACSMLATLAVYSPKLLLISVIVPLMDTLGRRRLLLLVLPLLATSLLVLALALDLSSQRFGPRTALAALLVYQSAFSCSLGPIPSMLSGMPYPKPKAFTLRPTR